MSCILQFVDALGNWTTLDYDGVTVLSTSASLQPGINRAQATGRPLIVDGSMAFPITLSATTTFGPANIPYITLRNVWLKSSVLPVVNFDTIYGGKINWTGRITYTGAAAAYPSAVVTFAPTNAIPNAGPDEPYPITKFGEIVLPQIENCGGSIYTVMSFWMTHGAIVNTRFKFDQINGSNQSVNGITVFNPPSEDNAFCQNEIEFGLVQGFTATGIQEGNGTYVHPLGTNMWRGAITPSFAGAYAGYQTFGVMSQCQFSSISCNGGALGVGVYFAAGSVKNYVICPQIQALTPVLNSGTGNVVVP